MKPEKLIKKQIIAKAKECPEDFYPVIALKNFNLQRFECSNCNTMFWATQEDTVCGDCEGGYSFIDNSPCGVELEFTQVYPKFAVLLS